MSYTNPDPMPTPALGAYHLFAPDPDDGTICSWCGDTQDPHNP